MKMKVNIDSITDSKKRRTFRAYFGGKVSSLLTKTQQKELEESKLHDILRKRGINLDVGNLEHGCWVCGYENLKWKYQNHSSDEKIKDIKLIPELGEESVCSSDCKNKADKEYEEAEETKQAEKAKLIVEITRLNLEIDTEIENSFAPFYNIIRGTTINNLKLKLIREEIKEEEFINKAITYTNALPLETREKQEIIKEVNTELGYFSPQVDLKELPTTYHNFASLKTPELRKVKSKIIEAIKNKREEKKLLDFLAKGASCANNELLSFIRNLENVASVHASQYEKSAYYNNAIRIFDSWLKEGENLVLSDTCPFRNFKEDIKKLRSESEIENRQGQAFQHVIEKFKKDVKNQLARDNIRQDREKNLEEFIEGKINKLQNLLENNQEEDLKGLNNKSEVSAVAKKMEEEINDAVSHAKKYKKEESGPNSNGRFFTH
ncbi:17145_t:CDS:2 [Funneliformis geosporum]|nr:17145_t:CDS:2 [Funneliformis geosporum]